MTANNLTLQDLADAIQIIDVVSKRGAINGDEMESVGALRNKFASFLQSSTPQVENVQPDSGPVVLNEEV
jgi:hypothetical protein